MQRPRRRAPVDGPGGGRVPWRPYGLSGRDHPHLLLRGALRAECVRGTPEPARLVLPAGFGACENANGSRCAAWRHRPVADLQRTACRRASHRRGRPDAVPARTVRRASARRFNRRDGGGRGARGQAVACARCGDPSHPAEIARRLQGGRAARGAAHGKGRFDRPLRRRLHAAAGLSRARHRPVCRRASRDGSGAVGPRESKLLAADARPGAPARRPLRPGAWRALPRQLFFQFQRRGGDLEACCHPRGGGLAGGYADGGSRSELSRATRWLAVRLPSRHRRSRRAAGRDERIQVAAASLGEGLDAVVPQAAASGAARAVAAPRQAGGGAPPDGESQLPAPSGALDIDGSGDRDAHRPRGRSPDALDRHAVLRRRRRFRYRLLCRQPTGAGGALVGPPGRPAGGGRARDRPVGQQRGRRRRGARRRHRRVPADAEVRTDRRCAAARRPFSRWPVPPGFSLATVRGARFRRLVRGCHRLGAHRGRVHDGAVPRLLPGRLFLRRRQVARGDLDLLAHRQARAGGGDVRAGSARRSRWVEEAS